MSNRAGPSVAWRRVARPEFR